MHVLGLVADEEISVETPHRRAAPGTGRGWDVEHNGVVGHRGHGGVDVGRHELGRRVLLPDSLVGSDVSAHRHAPQSSVTLSSMAPTGARRAVAAAYPW